MAHDAQNDPGDTPRDEPERAASIPLDSPPISLSNAASLDFDYIGWKIRIELDHVSRYGVVSGHADLFQASVFVCRLSLSGPQADGAGAMQSLARRARALVDERMRDAGSDVLG